MDMQAALPLLWKGMESQAGRSARSQSNALSEFEAVAVPILPDLYRAASGMLRNPTEAEDLVQDVFLNAWKSFHRFEPGTNIRGWLFKILFHRLHHYRRKWFQMRLLKEEETYLAEQLTAEEPVPEQLTDREILLAIEELSPEYRAVLLLADVEEFAYREISEMLKVPVGTVMSRLNRARKQMRQKLAARAAEEGIANLRDQERKGA
jgi:RNA polymerase sigma-70 factor (ECF subfamily)